MKWSCVSLSLRAALTCNCEADLRSVCRSNTEQWSCAFDTCTQVRCACGGLSCQQGLERLVFAWTLAQGKTRPSPRSLPEALYLLTQLCFIRSLWSSRHSGWSLLPRSEWISFLAALCLRIRAALPSRRAFPESSAGVDLTGEMMLLRGRPDQSQIYKSWRSGHWAKNAALHGG